MSGCVLEELAVAAAIAGIISAIRGFIEADITRQWQDSVSGKLDTIIIQNAAIMSQLQQLPLEFAADLQVAFTVMRRQSYKGLA
jgi:hypothetical protein